MIARLLCWLLGHRAKTGGHAPLATSPPPRAQWFDCLRCHRVVVVRPEKEE